MPAQAELVGQAISVRLPVPWGRDFDFHVAPPFDVVSMLLKGPTARHATAVGHEMSEI
jgi:hypothetical protein